jgi:hypothetical protein
MIVRLNDKSFNDDDAFIVHPERLTVSGVAALYEKDPLDAIGRLECWYIVRRHLAPSVSATPPIMKRWEATEADTVTYAMDTLEGGQL